MNYCAECCESVYPAGTEYETGTNFDDKHDDAVVNIELEHQTETKEHKDNDEQLD